MVMAVTTAEETIAYTYITVRYFSIFKKARKLTTS